MITVWILDTSSATVKVSGNALVVMDLIGEGSSLNVKGNSKIVTKVFKYAGKCSISGDNIIIRNKENEVYHATTKFEEIYQGSTNVLEANKNIVLQDDVVKEILVKDLKLDTNGDGEINYKEAAACLSLGYPAGTKYSASSYSSRSPFY